MEGVTTGRQTDREGEMRIVLASYATVGKQTPLRLLSLETIYITTVAMVMGFWSQQQQLVSGLRAVFCYIQYVHDRRDLCCIMFF